MNDHTRAALEKLQYNVTVVTVGLGGVESGLTVSWLSQVSFEPPILAFAVDLRHTSLEYLRSTKQFIVNLLGEDQRALAGHFAKQATTRPTKVDVVPHRASPDGGAILEGAAAWIECDVVEIKEIGDHALVFGAVQDGAVDADVPTMTTASSGIRYHRSRP